MDKKLFKEGYSNLIKKAWNDPHFRAMFLNNPKAFFREEGVEFPEGVNITIHANTKNELHFILPMKPEESFSEEQLAEIAAGKQRDYFDGLSFSGYIGKPKPPPTKQD